MFRKIWEKPEFNESHEETAWWTALQDKFMAAYKEAEADGSLGRGGVARRLGIMPGSSAGVLLDQQDAEMAARQAAARSMTTDDYIRMLVHQALLSREP